MLKILCEQYDFSPLSEAFDGEFQSDCGVSCEIELVDEQFIRELNESTRGIDSVTDVLSYPALDGIRGKFLNADKFPADIDEDGNLFIGSIAICENRAREQAEEYGHSYLRELFYLAVHGIWHLLGYDHMTEEDKTQMREREETVLKKLNLARGDE